MYWSDWGSSPSIKKASLDGSNVETVINTGVTWPNGLAIDVEEKRLYWADGWVERYTWSFYPFIKCLTLDILMPYFSDQKVPCMSNHSLSFPAKF